jgi:predicted O-methyltransferase YrrM
MNSAAQRVRERIERIYATGVVPGGDGQTYDINPVAVTPERGRFIRDVCLAENACASAETGMAWGLSTLFILEALIRNGAGPRAHIVMDPAQSSRFHDAALTVVREAGADELIDFRGEPSELALPRLIAEGRRLDFAYIDGNHQFEGVFLDFVFIHRLLKPGGVVIFDDLVLYPVLAACEYAENEYGYSVVAEDFTGVEDIRSRRFRAAANHRRVPWIRAYRKPVDAPPDDRFKAVPLFFAYEQYRRYAGNHFRHEGLKALRDGDPAAARRAFIAALRMEPRRLKTYGRLLRTFLPRGLARSLGGARSEPAPGADHRSPG